MRYGPRVECLEGPYDLEVLGEYADDAIGAAEKEVFRTGGNATNIILGNISQGREGRWSGAQELHRRLMSSPPIA